MSTGTAAGKRYMSKIAGMRCIVCELLCMPQEGEVEVHHIREDREERNDFLTLPLCVACHRLENGIHGSKTYLRMLGMSEYALLAIIIERMTT